MNLAIALVIGYLLGGIPFGVLIARGTGKNLQTEGSGNIGATNALRVLGPVRAILVLLGDAGKGILSSYIGLRLGGIPGMALGATGAAFGHAYPVALSFRGGKIVAVSLGVLIFVGPPLAAVAVTVFFIVAFVTRIVSVSALIGAFGAVVTVFVLPYALPIRLAVLVLFLLIVVRHKENLKRLMKGEERRLGQKA